MVVGLLFSGAHGGLCFVLLGGRRLTRLSPPGQAGPPNAQ